MSTPRGVLSGDRIYQLPLYQRPYAWSVEQVDALFENLSANRQLQSAKGGVRATILGSMIVLDTTSLSDGTALQKPIAGPFDMVDGQQRLITWTTILCVARDILADTNPEYADALHAMVVAPSHAEAEWRVTIRNDSEEVFTRFIKERGATQLDVKLPAHKGPILALLANRGRLRDLMERLHEDDPAGVRSFIEYALDHVSLAVIEADEPDDALDMFTSMNVANARLSETDQIKAIVLSDVDLSDPTIQDYVEEWERCGETLGSEAFKDLFAYLKHAFGRGNRPVIREHASIMANLGGGRAYLEKAFLPTAAAMMRLFRARTDRSDDPPEIEKVLVYLGWVKNREWMGPLIRWMQIGPSDETATEDFLRRLERRAYASLLIDEQNKDRADRFRAIEQAITADGIPDDFARLDISEGSQRAILKRLSRDFHAASGRICKLVLLRISDELAGTCTRRVPETLTVEHVLPRRPSDDSGWHDIFSDPSEQRRYSGLLGNLALTSGQKNRRMDGKLFPAKCEILFGRDSGGALKSSRIAVTDTLRDYAEWNQETISARDAQFGDIVKRMWSLEGDFGFTIARR
ncbi:MAG: DUF262 domain-containing HNH endonuclease family protein [Pseudomonadota bacterium]